MSEIGLNINVDSYNNEGIKTIKGNNNAEIYKLYILKNKRRLSLVGKTVKLGYVMAGTTNGDVIENLNITNAEQGEITFPITNRISKQDGVYSCQLAIYGADGFLEHTATFGLTVEANIFAKIAGEIADSKDFTYLENILDKASKLSEKLKENTSSATNANSNLESNITEANNINSKLLENTSTATSLNKNLESNIDLAKEVKETIKDLDTKNIEATEKIETLTGLNNKAQELSNNIQQALPFNSELVRNTESAKVTNTNLAATNQEATTKNIELQASLENTKEFINGLDGSQNIPQIRMDVTELQNGLKSNQSLAYKGSSISADNTLEGRTEGMVVKGRTLQNLFNIKRSYISTNNKQCVCESSNSNYSNGEYTLINLINKAIAITIYDNVSQSFIRTIKILGNEKKKITLSENEYIYSNNGVYDGAVWNGTEAELEELKQSLLVLRGDYANVEINSYFEGLKSFGEAEKVGDKYKISILSSNAIKIIGKYVNYANDGLQGDNYQSYVIKCDGVKNIAINLKDEEINRFGVECWKSDNFKNQKDFVGNLNYFPNKFTKQIFSPLEGTKYIKIYLSNNMPIDAKKLSIEVFVDSFPNEDYREYKKDILIKEPLRENDLLYEDNGQVKVYRPTKQYTFTGNETIIFIKAREKTICFNVNFTNDGVDNSLNVMCNNFLVEASCYSYDVEGFFGTKKGIFCSILKSKLTTPDIEGFKAWLKANPTTIVYQLAEPTVEIVENCVDIDLDTYQEKTYFNILNSLPGTLDFKVPSNIGSVVQNMAKEVNNIWDVINNLLVPSLIETNKNIAMATIKNNLK